LASYIFNVDLASFKMILADFYTLLSGHRMTNFHWKLCKRIYNFLLFDAYCFAVSVTLQKNEKFREVHMA